jgi:hypothetical protein
VTGRSMTQVSTTDVLICGAGTAGLNTARTAVLSMRQSATPRGPTPAEPYGAPPDSAAVPIEAVMRERLAELRHQPEFGRELTAFCQDADGVTALVGSEVVRALSRRHRQRPHLRTALAGHRLPGGTLILLCPLAGTELFQVRGPVPLDGDIDLTRRGTDETDRRANRAGHHDPIGSLGVPVFDEREARRSLSGRVGCSSWRCRAHPSGGQGLNTSAGQPA